MKIFRLILIFLTFDGMAQTFVKGPYLLYDNDNTRMEVLWQMDGFSNDTLAYGESADYEAGITVVPEFGLDHQHRIILNGLKPGTKYYYRIRNGIRDFHASFLTAPQAGQQNLTFFAYGDSRSGIAAHDRLASMINDCWMDQGSGQTFILSMGDLVTSGDHEYSWTNELFDTNYLNIRRMMSHIPLMACRGNHEGSAVLFAKYFPFPYFEPYYYSMDYGPAHFIFLDLYIPLKPGSEQYQWLVNDLSHSQSPWKFVILHPPIWSAGGGHENSAMAQEFIEPLCEDYHVAMVFAGHNHYYARAVVKNSEGDSVIHITTGGGAPLHTPKNDQPNVVNAVKSHHFCKISIINENLLTFSAISDSGEIIDQFAIDRGVNAVTDGQSGNFLNIQPNPFSDHTVVEYTLDTDARVSISLYNLQGEEVLRIVPETALDQGTYKILIESAGLTRGAYICEMKVMTGDGKTQSTSRKVFVNK